MIRVINRARVTGKFPGKPFLEDGLRKVKNLGVALLVEEEHGLVAVIADHERFARRYGGRVRLEWMAR